MDTVDLTQQPALGKRPSRFLIGVGIAVVAMAVAALVMQGLRSTSLEPGSPQETASQFAQAVLSRDFGAAHDLLTAERRAECAVTSFPTWWGDRATAVAIDDLVVQGEVATVWVQVETVDPYDFPLDPFPYHYDESAWVSLERRSGEWRVDDASSSLLECARRL